MRVANSDVGVTVKEKGMDKIIITTNEKPPQKIQPLSRWSDIYITVSKARKLKWVKVQLPAQELGTCLNSVCHFFRTKLKKKIQTKVDKTNVDKGVAILWIRQI